MPPFNPHDMATELLGNIFNAVTGGDVNALTEQRQFFQWFPVGLPVAPREWDFMTGSLGPATEFDAAVEAEGGAEVENEALYLLQTAEAFWYLTDQIPNIEGIMDIESRNQLIREGTLGTTVHGEYGRILRECELPHIEPDPRIQAKLEQLRGMLSTTTKMTDEAGEPIIDPMTGEQMAMTSPSQFVSAYEEHREKAEQLELELRNLQAAAMSGDQEAVARLASTGPVLKRRAQAAHQAWEATGFKGQVETWRAEIARLTGESPVSRWAVLSEQLDLQERSGSSLGAFWDVRTVPTNLLRAGGWRNIDYSTSHETQFSEDVITELNGGIAVPIPHTPLVLSGDHSSTTETGLDIDETTEFGVKFEITEVPIFRPAVDMDFLLSDQWRLPDGADPLNDGAEPPNGSMVALPVKIVLVRNLELQSSFFKQVDTEFAERVEQGLGLKLWPFNIGGEVDRVTDTARTTTTIDREEGIVRVAGVQMVGFRCGMLPAAPAPNPQVDSWIGPRTLIDGS